MSGSVNSTKAQRVVGSNQWSHLEIYLSHGCVEIEKHSNSDSSEVHPNESTRPQFA